MNIIRNIKLEGAEKRPFLLDLFVKQTNAPKPIVVFTHGFKGFKDYGCWDLVGKAFANAGFVFVKYNFSHNGTSIDDPMNFGDLEAFGQNNFSKEQYDLGAVIDWLINGNIGVPISEIKRSEIYLIGHSRGGGASILKANEDVRVKKLVTWASVSDYEAYGKNEEERAAWEKEGVYYIENSRTKQKMPLYYQIYEDYIENKKNLDVSNAAKSLKIPTLVVHGTTDPTVPFAVAQKLQALNDGFELLSIENGDHVFGSGHPWDKEELPSDLAKVVEGSIAFLSS